MNTLNYLREEIINEANDYIKHLLRFKTIIILVYLLLEIFVFIKIGRSNTFMATSSLFINLFILCSLVLMFKDFKTTLKIFALSIPLIPIVLYLLFRLNMDKYGDVIYLVYFIVFIVNAIKEIQKGNIDFKLIFANKKFLLLGSVYFILTILGVLSVINSEYKLDSAKIFILGFAFMIFFSLIIISYKNKDDILISDLVFYLAVGVVLSGIPDTLIAFYTIFTRNNNTHLYGSLGSNFMLGYTILLLPFIIFNSLNRKVDSKHYYLYNLLMIIEVFVLVTQRSRGVLLALAICFFLVFFVYRERKLKLLIIAAIVLSSVTYNVIYRPEFNELREEISTNPNVTLNLFSKNEFINKILQQTKNRRPIWGLTFNIINDHPYYGIGPGQYRYYYLEYGGEILRSYKDAHNVILNIAVDFGIPFAVIFFFSLFLLWLKSFINGIKSKVDSFNRYLLLACIGIFCFMAYGNITGQAFMTFVPPISIVPAFILAVITTLMVIKTS